MHGVIFALFHSRQGNTSAVEVFVPQSELAGPQWCSDDEDRPDRLLFDKPVSVGLPLERPQLMAGWLTVKVMDMWPRSCVQPEPGCRPQMVALLAKKT